jgi:hypothetical protein
MKQLKKIKILPLTDFGTLNLQVASQKRYDLTVLDQTQTNELLTKLHEIVANTPGAIIATKQGDKTYVNTQIKSSKDKKKIFTFPEPNPICIYYTSANRHLQQSYALKNKLFSEEQHFDGNYHYGNFIEYFQETSEGVMLLSTTIEGFINQLLPENLQLEIGGIMKGKNEIEWLDITTKLRQVVQRLTGIDFQKTKGKDYANICLVIDLRKRPNSFKKKYQGEYNQLSSIVQKAC